VPELLESSGELVHHRAGNEHIVIGELRLRIDLKVLVANVATAHQGDYTVCNEQLVVHAVVQAALAEGEFDAANEAAVAAIAPRIEDADRHLRLPEERQQLLITGNTFRVVKQNSHPHAALRGALQCLRDQAPGFIAMKNVVLQAK